MKRIIALTCMLIICVCAMASCGNISFKKFASIDEFESDSPTLVSGSKITDLIGLNYKNTYGDILLFEDNKQSTNKNVYFYNVEKNIMLSSLTMSIDRFARCTSVEVLDTTFLLVLEKYTSSSDLTTEYTATLYDSNGNFIATKSYGKQVTEPSIGSLVKSSIDLFMFENTIYRVNGDGTYAALATDALYTSLPSFDAKNDSYYYELDEDCVTVYDHKLNEVFYWEMPFDAGYCRMNILSSGKMLVQYRDTLPADATEYDIFDGDGKYNVESIILDVKSGKEKAVDLSYMVYYNYANNAIFSYMNESIDLTEINITDFAYVIYFENGRLLENNFVCVSLNANNASIKGEIAPEFTSYYGNLPSLISETRYIYETKSGNTVIIDKAGKKIATIANESLYGSDYNEKLINLNGKLYDHDLKLLLDYKAQDLTLVGLMGHNAILSDSNNNAYLYDGYSKTKIYDYYTHDDYDYDDQYYVIRELSTTGYDLYNYTYYNESGQTLLTVYASSADVIGTLDGGAGFIVAAYENNTVNYYRITK